MRINGAIYVVRGDTNGPFHVTSELHKIGEEVVLNITVTFIARVEYNETVFECRDGGTSVQTTAKLIIRGINFQ